MYIGLGRRKEASAKIKLISGTGNIFINQQKTDLINKSIRGQIQAIQLGVARAICSINPLYRTPLKMRGFLTRDARSKERRKYGLKKARKAPQFSKR